MFSRSVELHGLCYNELVADGDNNTFYKLINRNIYNRPISKVECVNHKLRNFIKNLGDTIQSFTNLSTKQRDFIIKITQQQLQKKLRIIITESSNFRQSPDELVERLKTQIIEFYKLVNLEDSYIEKILETSNKYLFCHAGWFFIIFVFIHDYYFYYFYYSFYSFFYYY